MHFAGYQNELSDALISLITSTMSFQQLIEYSCSMFHGMTSKFFIINKEMDV